MDGAFDVDADAVLRFGFVEEGKKGMKGNHRVLVSAPIQRSADFDAAYAAAYPNGSRWDYLLSTTGRVAGAEVHPVRESEVETVIAKKEWSSERLRLDEPSLESAVALAYPPNASYAMTRNTPAARRLRAKGVSFPVRILAAI